ncbi:MAG: hypothetical protein ACI4X9_04685 [Kiritimatiellia bacterium]
MSFSTKHLMWLLAVLIGLGLGGCMADNPDQHTDMPWSTPSSWEGSMPMPGLSGGGINSGTY